MTDLIFRPHAVERMMTRNITSSLVEKIIKKPDGIIKHSFDKEIIYKRVKNRRDNMIAIVVLSRLEILTVMNFFEVKL